MSEEENALLRHVEAWYRQKENLRPRFPALFEVWKVIRTGYYYEVCYSWRADQRIKRSVKKVFGKAIHSLSRIGDDLWFDPTEHGLTLRVVNSARSAYACIHFSSFFFQTYQNPTLHEQGQGGVVLQLRCKLSMKSVLPMFRSLSSLDRNVDKCNIYTNFNNCRMVFQLFCKHGITKTYMLTYEDSEPLQAAFSKTKCPNVLKIQSRSLSDAMIHFPTGQEEVTLTITPFKVSFKSYSEETLGLSKAMHTEIHLSKEEFSYFQVGVNSEVTFCLKEFKGFLAFAETVCACVTVNFGQPGKPVVFTVEDLMFEANFILATLEQSESRTSTQSSQCTVPGSNLGTPHFYGGKENMVRFAVNKKINKIIPQNDHLALERPEYPENVKRCQGGGNQSNSSTYTEFRSLFFGEVSSRKNENEKSFYSLATASDEEEEEPCMQRSDILT
uniref:Cell cycle checkpoint control protein n=1 Tax=Leptobrachium leishanense TaxID=445787 RepID=A0A8C5PGN5_9ANUR